MKFTFLFALVLTFSFWAFSPALADVLSLDVNHDFSYYNPEGLIPINGPTKAFCTHRYERLFENQVYQCVNTKAVWYSTAGSSITEEYKSTWLKFNCWQAMYGAGNGGYNGGLASNDRVSVSGALILKQSYDFSTIKPEDFNFQQPCKPKLVTSQTMCNINTQSIINLAFSQRFPLDLFIGLEGFSSPTTCPQFTIRNQTFSLCYLKKLVASLKYVLLLVFVISSIIAL